MKFTPLGEIDLTYVGPMTLVDYGAGGQYYADMEGTWRSDRISGSLRLTNIAQKRADNVNTPTLRGVLETDDGATMFVEMNGISQIEKGGRVFVSSLTLRSAAPNYQWVNTLFAAVEGELYGPPRPNELQARCRVYACEPTISSGPEGGETTMRAIAYAVPVLPGMEGELQSLSRELKSRAAEYEGWLRRSGVAREAAFLQRTPQGSYAITYRELDESHAAPSQPDGEQGSWFSERISAVHGFDPADGQSPRVELLVRQRPTRRARLYAAALPLLPNKTARFHEFAAELNGIHAAEFEESVRRLGFGLTLFVQHTPELDLAISVIEGEEPATALGRLAMSKQPFDRWHVQQIADQTGLDLASPPPPPNDELWQLDAVAVRTPSLEGNA
jgi:Family of unknown function (DUF6176)